MIAHRIGALVCLSGLDPASFMERAAPHVPLDRPLVLLFVIDTRSAEQLGHIGRRLIAAGRVRSGGEARMAAADEHTAQAVLQEAAETCRALGYDMQEIRQKIRRGRPEQEILLAAQDAELDVGLIVIGASFKGGPSPLVGPASVGPVARYIVEHAPCDVLLLR